MSGLDSEELVVLREASVAGMKRNFRRLGAEFSRLGALTFRLKFRGWDCVSRLSASHSVQSTDPGGIIIDCSRAKRYRTPNPHPKLDTP